ncbi:MAG: hypothetical protein MJ212_06390, partial [Alphaproteobacteria bacterium]|nr:hypothetical protein [Alphaproteobacteria bacterium]
MIAYTTFLLFMTGIFSSIKVSVKTDRLLSFVAFVALFLIFGNFCNSWLSGDNQTFSFIWNSSPSGNINFDIISNPYNYGIILPFFIVTLLSVLHIQIFHYEEKRSSTVAFLAFNLAILTAMITSNNFVQLLSAVFIADILSVLIIKNNEASRNYTLMNMAADMILFMVVAIMNSLVDSLDIRQILTYKKSGFHADFLAVFGLTAVFMKFGFFTFHIGILSLKNIRLHRLLEILFLSAPLTALILLLKFNILWRESAYFLPYLNVLCILTLIFGFCGSLVIDCYKAKIIYWQLMFWALFVELLKFNGFVWSAWFTSLFLGMYILSGGLYLLHYYFNRRPLVSQFMAIKKENKYPLLGAFLIIFSAVISLSMTLANLYNNANRYYIWAFAVLFTLSLSAVLRQILFLSKRTKLLRFSQMPTQHLVTAEMMLFVASLLYYFYDYHISIIGVSVFFVLLCFFNPLHKLSYFYEKQNIQNLGLFTSLYKNLIAFLQICGKILWLLIDRLFMD